ncbi:MAG: transposase, partial [Candidatus Methanoculleus thermohydrogenotrophicum]
VDRFGTIVFEDLNITNMQKNPHLAKSIADVAWNQFKAEEAGSRVILVNPRNTSQQCSRCGMIVAKTLSDRVHSCPQCGLAMDRDQNAGVQHYEIGAAISRVIPRMPLISIRGAVTSPSSFSGNQMRASFRF